MVLVSFLSEVDKGILQIATVSLLETDIVEVMVLSPIPETGRSKLEIFTLPKILPLGKEKPSNLVCPVLDPAIAFFFFLLIASCPPPRPL